MAIILIKEVAERQSTADYVNSRKTTRKTSRKWIVITDDPHDEQATVEAAWVASTGIVGGTLYPGSNYVRAKSFSANCVGGGGKFWEVVCNYESNDNDTADPLQQPAVFRVNGTVVQVSADYDRFGQAIVNTAGEAYSDSLKREQTHPVVTVEQNEATYSLYIAMMYSDTINSNTFLGCPPHYWKASFISGDEVIDDTAGSYWKVKYEFKFNPLSWDRYVLSTGYQEYVPNKGLRPINAANGQASTTPSLLDQNGKRIVPNSGVQPYWQKWQIYNPVPFTWTFRT